MEQLLSSSARQMAAAVRSKEVSPVELVDAHIERIEALNPDINAVVLDRFDQAREEARSAGAAVQSGAELGPLHGLPFTAKEPIEIEGMSVCGASKIFDPIVSAQDAVVVASLRAAGAIPIAKTNIPEFALHYDSNNIVYGATQNPHMPGRTAGGSSGGEAAALVTGMTPIGVGSDYGGSVRIPASYCGCVGLKVGRDVVPYSGHFPPTSPMSIQRWSVIGPLARYVEDLELLLPIFATPDKVRDPDCFGRGFEASSADGLPVAIYWQDDVTPVEPIVRDAVEMAGKALTDAGHEIAAERPPMQAETRELYLTAAGSEVGGLLMPLIGVKRDDLSPQMGFIMDELLPEIGTELAPYAAAFVMELMIEQQVAAWQQRFPIAIAPIVPGPAFELGANVVDVAGEKIRMVDLMSYCTYVNVLGLPAAAVPVTKTDDGLPIGVQVIGRRDCEMEVLAVAKKLEQAFGGWMEPQRLAAATS